MTVIILSRYRKFLYTASSTWTKPALITAVQRYHLPPSYYLSVRRGGGGNVEMLERRGDGVGGGGDSVAKR